MALFDWLPASRGRVRKLEARQVTDEEKIKEVAEDIAAVKGDLTTIATGITALKDQIVDLKALIDAGADSSAALDALVANAESLKVQADAVAGVTAPEPTT